MNKYIKFVYWHGHVCRVWGQYFDGTLQIEHTVENLTSYYFLIWPSEYKIVTYG